jgi:multidrug resistance efflux pump
MDICSPKDGFVLELFVQPSSRVEVGQPLIQLDSEFEDRALARIDTMEATRQLTAAQYKEPQVDLIRQIASIAVSVAEANMTLQTKVNHENHRLTQSGAANPNQPNALVQEYNVVNATKQHEKAVNQLKQFELSVSRHNEIDALASKHAAVERGFIENRKTLLKILAPIAGIVDFRVAKGSFAELGSILLSIKESK